MRSDSSLRWKFWSLYVPEMGMNTRLRILVHVNKTQQTAFFCFKISIYGFLWNKSPI